MKQKDLHLQFYKYSTLSYLLIHWFLERVEHAERKNETRCFVAIS